MTFPGALVRQENTLPLRPLFASLCLRATRVNPLV